jgi:hypothetical protein
MFSSFFRSSMNSTFDAQEIEDGLWLGSYDAACANISEMESRNIGYVLSVGDGFEQVFANNNSVLQLTSTLLDSSRKSEISSRKSDD